MNAFMKMFQPANTASRAVKRRQVYATTSSGFFQKSLPRAATALTVLLLAGCARMDMGSQQAKTVATGAAAGANATNANVQLETCEFSLGTVSLVENQEAGWYTILTRQYRLPPASQLLRLMIQQSNCFVVVERSATGMRAMGRERALMGSGEMRGGSGMGKGQIVASDYALSPEVIFSQPNASGRGGLLGVAAGVLGILIGVGQTHEVSTLLTLVDTRSGVQVSIAEGSAANTDFSGFAGVAGGSAGGTLGGYANTAEGKVIAAAFMDGYNQMVRALRGYRAQAVPGQGLGGGGRLAVDGGGAPAHTAAGNGVIPLKTAQERLNRLGYDAGVADGIMGRQTSNALTRFQIDHNLPPTGRLDAPTSNALQ